MTLPALKHPSLGYRLVFNINDLDMDAVYAYLSETAYWSIGIARNIVDTSWKNSLVFGILDDNGKHVGACRVVTDKGTYAYLADVYVLEAHQGKGLGRWMLNAVMSHPALSEVRRFMLATADMHDLYRSFGFTDLARPEILMEKLGDGAFR